MPTVKLNVVEGGKVAVPGTGYALGVDTLRHRIASTAKDPFPRSMLTAVFTLYEGERVLAEERGCDGDRVRLGPLTLRFLGQGDGPASVAVELDVP